VKRLVLLAGFVISVLALAQDVPTGGCYPCQPPDQPSTCSLCHTWGNR
jgi:hypothetical protein